MEFFRQRNISHPAMSGGGGKQDFSFTRLTETEYRLLLEESGYSEHYIEGELKKLRQYKELMETEGVRTAKLRLARKQEAEADPVLQDYIKANKLRKERIKQQRGQEDAG